MKINGWTRIVIVCSALWLLAIAIYTRSEFNAVSAGEASKNGLATLRDSKTGREFGRRSKSVITEIAALEAEQARRKELRAADPIEFEIEEIERERRRSMTPEQKRRLIALEDERRKSMTPAERDRDLELEQEQRRRASAPQLVAVLGWPMIAKWSIFPLAGVWAAFFAVRWILAGFHTK